jgi:Uncharacterized protein conserved in bacteria (DUF2252)
VSRPALAVLRAMGKGLRDKYPRESHAEWKAPHNRPDPLRLLEQSNKGRIRELIPIRFGRMLRTPFTFYRGAALNMAEDLAHTPASGLRVQACLRPHSPAASSPASASRWRCSSPTWPSTLR